VVSGASGDSDSGGTSGLVRVVRVARERERERERERQW
jgi:hypothetical protein